MTSDKNSYHDARIFTKEFRSIRVLPHRRVFQDLVSKQKLRINVLLDPVHWIHQEGNVKNQRERKIKKTKQRDQNTRGSLKNSFKPGSNNLAISQNLCYTMS